MELNTGLTDPPEDVCFHQRFEAQVEKTPIATAIVFEGQRWSYQHLNRRTNQLAHYLQALGVGPEVLVGVHSERSLDLAVGILAILKAGGACVPLDPAYPSDRLALMLEDSQIRVVLTQEHLLKELPKHGARVICVDSEWEAIATENEKNPASGVRAENLAFVFYTSGSTGRPKGVMGTHRAYLNDLLWKEAALEFTKEDRHMLKCSISFSPFLRELFCPLFTGATMIVARPGGQQDIAYLGKLIAEQKVTVISFVPSVLSMFLEGEGLEACKSLRHVLCGGEALPVELRERFFSRVSANLHTFYGATEAPAATHYPHKREDNRPDVTLGRPTNMQVYLLDRGLRPVPVGIPGEVYIGGAGVTRGYLNRPDLTAERFIPHPFSDERGARLYKTGDLGRYRPDGTIEFLGRLDHQVKIRGFRIELNEVETVLRQHPALRETAVIVREDTPGNKRLVAYVVAKREPAPAAGELRSFMGGKLPEYMVPSLFVILESMPLTPNGKVDHQALPSPEQARRDLRGIVVAPRTFTEEVLARIWAEVLELEKVGIRDNFFDLGGQSLLATQMMVRLRAVLEVDLTPSHLFEAPTVADLAELVEARLWAARQETTATAADGREEIEL